MRHQCIRIDRNRARQQNRVRQFELQSGAESRRAFGDFRRQIHDLPGLHDCPVAFGERFLARAKRAGQNFRDRHCRYCKGDFAGIMPVKQRLKSRREFWMPFQDIDDRRRIDQDQRAFGQPRKV